MPDPHFAALERMYLAAPINTAHRPEIAVAEGGAVVTVEATPALHHSAGAVHGSAVFKLLDDAAYFAAASLVRDVFVVTAQFTVYFTRPVVGGVLRAEGRVAHAGRQQTVAEAVVTDEDGREVGRGSGLFVRGRAPLAGALGYADDSDASSG